MLYTLITATMDPLHLLFAIETLFWLVTAFARNVAAGSAYDVLQAHGLPAGPLPQGVRKFSIDDSGRFEVKLDSTCTVKFENEVQYDANMTGTLSLMAGSASSPALQHRSSSFGSRCTGSVSTFPASG